MAASPHATLLLFEATPSLEYTLLVFIQVFPTNAKGATCKSLVVLNVHSSSEDIQKEKIDGRRMRIREERGRVKEK